MSAVPLFLIHLIFFSSFSSTKALADSVYMNQLIKKAGQQKLYQDPYWLILLHYKRTPFGVRSLIDDPTFFLSPKGKFEPQAELEATLNAFFTESDQDNTPHPVCTFNARFSWLSEKLSIDTSKLPMVECELFEQTMSQIKPASATIVFPTYFMNSPASMFGHTLITINTKDQGKLLSHAVNYSAVTPETNGVVFAFKGLFGFYKGYYSFQPYYQKIQQYSDISQRDIWEYSLTLTEDEVLRMVRHLWELQDIYARYYFFDENCSYNLLFLLEAARPSLRLTNRFPLWALPIDTIKAIKENGLIDGVEYRPSLATKIKHKLSLLDKEECTVALKMVTGSIEPDIVLTLPIEKQRKIQIVELATECLRYRRAKDGLALDDYRPIFLKLLRTRSDLGTSDTDLSPLDPPPQPDTIHDSNRFSLAVGWNDGRFFQEIGYRPVFSDLLDTDVVYGQGTQIQFGNARVRYYSSENKPVLQELSIIDIESISPRDDFFKPFSWKFNTGWTRRLRTNGDESTVYTLNAGPGLAFFNDYLGLYYAFAEPDVNVSGGLKNSYSLGMGLSAGILKNLTLSWKCHLFAKKTYYEYGERQHPFELSFAQNIRMTRNQSVGITVGWEENSGHSQAEARLAWHVFF